MNDSATMALLMVSTGSWLLCLRSRFAWVHLVGLTLLVGLVVNFVAIDLRNSGRFNAHVINAYSAFEYIFIGVALLSVSDIRKAVGLIFLVGCGLVSGLLIRDCITGAFFNWPATSAIIVAGFFLALMAMVGLYRLAYTSNEPLMGQPVFWLYNIVLIYFFAQVPIFGLMSKLDHVTASAIYNLHAYLAIFHELALTCLFLFIAYQTKSLKHEG